MTKFEKLLLVTNLENVFRAKVELGLAGKIKSVELSDFKNEKSIKMGTFIYANKIEEFLDLDIAHISQGFDNNSFFSNYKSAEKIVEVYSLKIGKYL